METIAGLFTESVLKKGAYYSKSGHYCKKMSFVQSDYIGIFSDRKDKEITQLDCYKRPFLDGPE